jgi:DNA-binding CsgD family transcriptional regulator
MIFFVLGLYIGIYAQNIAGEDLIYANLTQNESLALANNDLMIDSIHCLNEDLERANSEIKHLNVRSEILLIIVIIALPLITFIAVLILFRFRYMKKAKEASDLVAIRSLQEAENLKKERVITDMQISRKNHLLEVISQQIDDNTKGFQEEFVKLFKDNKKHDKNFENFKNLTKFVNPDFYGQLDKKASPNKLTILDLKYCAFIHLGLSNTDIAELLNVTQETVKVQKSKLKHKLKLSKNESLFDYLNKSLNYNSISSFSNGNGNKQV